VALGCKSLTETLGTFLFSLINLLSKEGFLNQINVPFFGVITGEDQYNAKTVNANLIIVRGII